VTEAVTVGTAVVAYIEPHEGRAREFNRWYERDHFYAAALAGPGMYAGARWVATHECKRVRPLETLFGDPARGSYLATYWLLPGMQATWDDWAATQYRAMTDDRRFAGRDHLHTAVHRFVGDARVHDAPPPAVALDHGFAGVVAVATTAGVDAATVWARALVCPEVPLATAFAPDRVIMSETNPEPYALVLGFVEDDPLGVWHERVAPLLAGLPALGFASPFLRTVPGTDRYTDDL
jgi:hypothetical protein